MKNLKQLSLEIDALLDQNDHSAQTGGILNDDQPEHSNHNNDKPIIENLPNTKNVQISKPLSFPTEDASVLNTNPILTNPSLSIPSMASLNPQDKCSQDKHIELVNIIGNLGAGMLTRDMAKELSTASAHECLFVDFLSKKEPKKVFEALKHRGWVRLVTLGYNQQKSIDYDETIALVAILEAIRIFLAFSTYMNFIVYQMDAKSAFLNGKLKEEVYVKQPPGFESSEFPNHICKLDKALYGLKQAPRAWYETLSAFLTEHKFVIGKMDNTLFVYKTQTDVILVQLYVIFRFQIKQSERGISINQEKYGKDLLKKYDINGLSEKTPMSAKKQQFVAMSSVEVEYVAAVGCCANILCMKSQLTDYDIIYDKYTAKARNNSKVWFSTPTRGIFGEVGVNTFRNAIGAHYLPHSSKYVAPPSIETIRQWFPTIGYGMAVEAKGTLKKSLLPPRWRIYYAKLIWEDIITKLNKKTREKVVPYTRFLSLFLEHKMKGYRNYNATLNPTKVFSVHNWALKKNQPEGPPFTDHMLAICNANVPVKHKAPNTSSYSRKKDSKGKKPRAKSRHRKQPTSSKHHPLSKIEAGNQRWSASGCDALVDSTTEIDHGISAPNYSISKQQDMDKGTQNYSIDNKITGTDPYVLVEKTKSTSEGLKIILTKPVAEKEAKRAEKEAKHAEKEKEIKLEDLSKLVQNVDTDFMDMDSPEDDEPIIVQDESDEEAHAKKVQTEEPKVTKDALASIPPSPKTVQIQELSTQLLVLQTLNSKVVRGKEATETKAAWFKTQPSYPNVEQLSQLLVNSIKTELFKLLSSHDFASLLPTKLKEIPSKFNELTGEIKELKKHVHDLKIEMPRDLKEIPNKL
ncbi:retrovirus-related pol polyprotein from transposon TNT 1-94 [Tanacetum coccineum]